MLHAIENNLLENIEKKSQVVIISANGPVFSSGHDLKELVQKIKFFGGSSAMTIYLSFVHVF